MLAFMSVPWCSGYHVRLTRERSWVRNPAEPRGLNSSFPTLFGNAHIYFLFIVFAAIIESRIFLHMTYYIM